MIDKILYINLSRRVDRNENIMRQIRMQNLEAMTERIDAVDGRKLKIGEISNNDITEQGKMMATNKKERVYIPLTLGGIGCALSHKKIYEKIVDEELKNTLVLEDDVKIEDNLMEKI